MTRLTMLHFFQSIVLFVQFSGSTLPNIFFKKISAGSKPLEEYTIPKGTITRIMRQVLPQDSRVTGGAKDTMDQCIVQFSTALVRAATQECRRDRRLTITADDLIVGFANLGLADYVQPMSVYLRLYRETVNNQQQAVAPPAPTVQRGTTTAVPPPPPNLTLQLGLPSVPDVTELARDTDVYALWHGAAPAAGSTTSASSVAPMPPPAADGDEDE